MMRVLYPTFKKACFRATVPTLKRNVVKRRRIPPKENEMWDPGREGRLS